MRLGLIARMDNSGLGTQTWEAYRHLKPHKTMVIDYAAYKDMDQYPQRYDTNSPQVVYIKSMPTPEQIDLFLDDLDLVFMCETPYSYYLLSRARERGVKTIIQPNYEFSGWMKNDKLPRPDVFGLPTEWHYDDFPEPKLILPVPIATDRFDYQATGTVPHRFLHVVGTPAANDRNGTGDLIQALKQVKSSIVMTLSTQRPDTVAGMVRGAKLPPNVQIKVEAMRKDNYWDLYRDQDVMVMPRRYGGLCLPVNEALGAGMPVIMPRISPNQWLPEEWLVGAKQEFKFQPGRLGNDIDVFSTPADVLAAKIDHFVKTPGFYPRQLDKAKTLAHKHSWDQLKKLYEQTFELMIKS